MTDKAEIRRLAATAPTSRHPRPPPPRRLRKAEVAELSRVIRAEGVGQHPASRSAAIAALSGHSDAAELLAEVAGSELEELAVRSAAIGALAKLPGDDPAGRLLRLCSDANPVIRIKALRNLAAVGGETAYAAIDTTHADAHVAKQARFTRAVIAHRLDLGDDPLADVSTPGRPRPAGDLANVEFRGLSPEETAARLARTFGETYGVRPASDLGFELSIGGAKWFIAVDKSAIRRGELRPALDRKQVLAVFALWDEETGDYDTQHLALTAPQPSGTLRLVVIRPDGEIIHVGTLEAGHDRVAFTTSSTARKGATPGSLSGSVSGAEVSLVRAIVASSRRAKKRVRPLRTGVVRASGGGQRQG